MILNGIKLHEFQRLSEIKLRVLTCDNCNGSFGYEDDGKTFACMPDGEVVGSCWYCSDCCAEREESKWD